MKILIVEDDNFFRNFYTSKLKEKGYEVDSASDGIEGLEKIKIWLPDLILLDIIMPKMDGFELLTRMRNENISMNIPVIVFSTLGQEVDVEKAKMLGAKDYINKSYFDFENMLQKIKSFLPTK
ncbi:MAG: response regulator [bacterium]|nr:response regulator [bacterium]